MNALQRDLKLLVAKAEANASLEGRWRLGFHIMPPVGWLNDPNGLCHINGEYHFFFQYSPFNPEGGLKLWGHYKSRDMLHWQYMGAPLLADTPEDCHGAYSGSAIEYGGRMHIFYTGNVKLMGDYDYINNGRKSDTIHAVYENGRIVSKATALTDKDYPQGLTLHVRDPKVWEENGRLYMALGARRTDDSGEVLIYGAETADGPWKLKGIIKSEKKFGYMWECPDVFEIGGRRALSVSPQGVEADGFKYNNIYQSGYYFINGDIFGDYSLSDFTEWDCGFDFYAPQTFEDENGRRIMVGWMGMPDIEELYSNPTAELGWQHAFTLPREIRLDGEELIQLPVKELETLRGERMELDGEAELDAGFELYIDNRNSGEFRLAIDGDVVLEYRNRTLSLRFEGKSGYGRTERLTELAQCRELRVFVDTSSIEAFADGGRRAFTTRFYPEGARLSVKLDGAEAARAWRLSPYEVCGIGDKAL